MWKCVFWVGNFESVFWIFFFFFFIWKTNFKNLVFQKQILKKCVFLGSFLKMCFFGKQFWKCIFWGRKFKKHFGNIFFDRYILKIYLKKENWKKKEKFLKKKIKKRILGFFIFRVWKVPHWNFLFLKLESSISQNKRKAVLRKYKKNFFSRKYKKFF